VSSADEARTMIVAPGTLSAVWGTRGRVG